MLRSHEGLRRSDAMAIEVRYPHVEKVDGQPARPSKSPRIRVAQLVMDYLAHGWSADEMCRQHDYLTPAEAHAALLYYWDHREEIDREITDELNEYERERANTPPSLLTVRLRANAKVDR
jgi:uncharacterized protein (DUF433 family)